MKKLNIRANSNDHLIYHTVRNIGIPKFSLFGERMLFILGVTKRYSATLDDTDSRVVSFVRLLPTTTIAYLSSLLFGQSQQAGLLNSDTPFRELHTTKVVHAYIFTPVVSRIDLTTQLERSYKKDKIVLSEQRNGQYAVVAGGFGLIPKATGFIKSKVA